MSDRHYLLRVMGLSAVPRLVTSTLTLISFPLMVRSLGASAFGVVVYIGAITSVLESFVDFGVSSAAGKGIAAAREAQSEVLGAVVRRWTRLQATVALLGLVPLLGASYVVAVFGSHVTFSVDVLVTLVFATWVTISLNFVRASLTSLLAFRSLAMLDSTESLIRSASWLCVAYLMPSALGLAIANVATAVCASIVGATLLKRRLPHRTLPSDLEHAAVAESSELSLRYMLRESASFLWLRLATRVFLSAPIVVFGKLFGSEVVGVVGAFNKIVDLTTFPFSVIGNALAVRATGVAARGVEAVRSLWDVVARLVAVAVVAAVTVYLGAQLLARLLTPSSHLAAAILSVLSVSVITMAVQALVTPMSDYVGALGSRNVLLTVFTFIQVAAIWVGAVTLGPLGAVGAYVLVLVLKNIGYVLIALRAFFPATRYVVRSEVVYFLAAVAGSLIATILVAHAGGLDRAASRRLVGTAVEIILFWTLLFLGLIVHAPAKRFFITRSFFEFQPEHG